MNKLHHMAKHSSSSSLNRENFDKMLAKSLYLPRNQLEHDHNGTSIAAACKLVRSELRVKGCVMEHCRQFNADPFLSEDEWKTTWEFEGMLRETSLLTTNFQNEEKLNAAHGPVMRKALHDSLSKDTMDLVDAEDWSVNKERTHPKWSEVNLNSFTDTGLACRTQTLLEC